MSIFECIKEDNFALEDINFLNSQTKLSKYFELVVQQVLSLFLVVHEEHYIVGLQWAVQKDNLNTRVVVVAFQENFFLRLSNDSFTRIEHDAR